MQAMTADPTLMTSSDPHTLFVWLVYACLALLYVCISLYIVHFFQPRNHRNINPLTTDTILHSENSPFSSHFVNIACAIAICLSFISICTAPIDVYILENSDPRNVAMNRNALKQLYQIYFAYLIAFSFVGAPFAYNYSKQREIAHVSLVFSQKQHLITALRRTLCFMLGLALLCSVVTIFVLCGRPKESQIHWLKPLLHFSSDMQAFFLILLGTLTFFGLYIWIFVCGRGLAYFPVSRIMNNGDEEERHSEGATIRDLLHENDIEEEAIVKSKGALCVRYMHEQNLSEPDPSLMSLADQERLSQIKHREKLLKDRKQVLEVNMKNLLASKKRWQYINLPFGILVLFQSLIVILSVLVTNLDKAFHSSFRLGFVLNKIRLSNPIDALLVLTSQYFPIDYVLFGTLVFYMYAVSYAMLVRHKVRFACFQFGHLRPHLTATSTMTIVSLMMMHLAVIGSFSLLTIAPQYATFGHQKFVDTKTGDVRSCTLEEAARASKDPAATHCRMTQLAEFYNSLVIHMPMFGLFFYLGQWLLVFTFVPWLAHSYSMMKPLSDPDPMEEKLLSQE